MNIKVAGGTLTVLVGAAEDQDGYVGDNGPRQEWAEAAVQVKGDVKVRGITYTVDVEYRWLRFARAVYVDGRETEQRTHWQESRHGWREGYRRADSRKKVEARTATDKAIDAMVAEALDAFVLAEPDWQRESFAIRLRYKISREAEEARVLRERAAKHDATAETLRKELATLETGE